MTTRKEFEAVEAWVEKNRDLLELVMRRSGSYGSATPEEENIRALNRYHYLIKELDAKQREYVFGERMTTLDDIKQHMVDYLEREFDLDEGVYDAEGHGRDEDDFDPHDDGYANAEDLRDIRRFWQQIDDDKVRSILAGRVEDDYEIELDGHRYYIMGRSGIYPMLYNYVAFGMKATPADIEENMHNSNDEAEEVLELYMDAPGIPTNEQSRALLIRLTNEENNRDIEEFGKAVRELVKRFDGKAQVQEKVERLKELI